MILRTPASLLHSRRGPTAHGAAFCQDRHRGTEALCTSRDSSSLLPAGDNDDDDDNNDHNDICLCLCLSITVSSGTEAQPRTHRFCRSPLLPCDGTINYNDDNMTIKMRMTMTMTTIMTAQPLCKPPAPPIKLTQQATRNFWESFPPFYHSFSFHSKHQTMHHFVSGGVS